MTRFRACLPQQAVQFVGGCFKDPAKIPCKTCQQWAFLKGIKFSLSRGTFDHEPFEGRRCASSCHWLYWSWKDASREGTLLNTSWQAPSAMFPVLRARPPMQESPKEPLRVFSSLEPRKCLKRSQTSLRSLHTIFEDSSKLL